MDHSSIAEDALLETDDDGDEEEADNDEEGLDVLGVEFSNSKNDVNDDDFKYDDNAPEHVVVGLNSDHDIEEAQQEVDEHDSGSDHSCDPSSEELHTDHSSGEENNVRYSAYNEENEIFDPKFEVGKTFRDIPQFRKAIKNHGVATRCNLRFKTNDNRRANAVYKTGCKWRIWASENKKLNCIQIKSYNPNHNCIRYGMNRHCTAKYVAERYLETFRVDPEWKTSAIRLRVFQDVKINIVRQTASRAWWVVSSYCNKS